eukprot:TRINITY_DN19569_c0_g1_i1.p2 TRINITY_DN19569_c0_g1~~TRINITY_DN19569_c0_g1_i1.p2  ORF type:complete len:100 (-),score=11.90 TRINITY_DN19569_c0_g1_i1:316-615(-)
MRWFHFDYLRYKRMADAKIAAREKDREDASPKHVGESAVVSYFPLRIVCVKVSPVGKAVEYLTHVTVPPTEASAGNSSLAQASKISSAKSEQTERFPVP